MNSVSVRTYGQNSDTLAVIRELKKLGIIKSVAKAKGKPKPKMMEDLKQESDMVGYVKTLEGQPGRGDPNLFALRQIEPGMSEQEIEDIQERNNAGIAALRAEVAQQRLEDVRQQERFIGGLASAAAGRFGQLESGLADIQSGKFGASSEPMRQSSVILLPDVQEKTLSQTLNEGGPRAQPQVQTELFAEGEEVAARLGPQERLQIGEGTGMSSAAAEALGMPESFIAKTKKATKPKAKLVRDAQDAADALGLGKIPTMRNTYNAIEEYYIALTDQIGDRDVSLNSKSLILADINSILEGYFN
jgi:hypothetical protein